jgi:ribosomal protein L29
MDIKELRQKSDKELNALVLSLRERIRALRFDASAGAVKQVHGFKEAKKTIARALTELSARARVGKPQAK